MKKTDYYAYNFETD
jgi:hypothetical protein